MSTGDSLWRNRGFPSCHLQHLPHNFRSDDDVTLAIDYARQSEVTSSFKKMVLDAATREDNVGTDEYKDDILGMLEFCEVFTARRTNIKDHSFSGIAAFIVLGPSKYSRTLDPCLADLFVFRSRDVTDVTYIGLVRLAVGLARLVDVGYTDCMMSVATSCCNLLTALRHEGFEDVVSLPRAVVMVDAGLTDTVLLMKNVGLTARPPRSVDEVLSMLDKHKHTVPSDSEFLQATLPHVSFLPQQYKFKCGLTATLRQLRKDEAFAAWQLFKLSADRGEGYSIHYLPDLAFFRYRMIMKKTSAVAIEDNASGKLMGCVLIGPSGFARTAGICVEGIAMDAEFQNRGLGRELRLLSVGIALELGYRSEINVSFANNVRQRKVTSHFGDTTVGIVPHAAYMKGIGWTDLVVLHNDIKDKYPSFTEIIAKNRQQAQTERVGSKL